MREEVGGGEVRDVVGDFEFAEGAGAFGMDNTAGDVRIDEGKGGRGRNRSGIRSRSKCARRSMRWKSWRRSGPWSPTFWEALGLKTGQPWEVV